MSDTPDDPRTTFLKSLPRKIVEIKATLGALIADPRSSRMRDELRRRLHALLTLARSYNLMSLADTLRAAEETLDASRATPSVSAADIDRLTALIASLPSRVERDVQVTTPEEIPAVTLRGLSPPEAVPLGTTRTMFPPPGTRSDLPPPTSLRPRPVSSRPPLGAQFQLPTALATAQSLLFAGGHSLAATLRSQLPPEMEFLPAETLSDAIFLARDTAPDVIVAETEPPADGISLLTALRSDPLTDFLPVILLARHSDSVDAVRSRCPEAAEVLTVTTDAAVLRAALERVLSNASPQPPSPDLGELTLEELSRALADEIRRGLVTSASTRGRNTRLSLGAGTEVLSATWEAIARIREVLEQQSDGAVRFDVNTAPRGLPGTHVFSMSEGSDAGPERAYEEDPLPGRKALVVDDDPKVVATFSALLTDAGMTVIEQTDGASALRASRAARPDVVIADILMPGIDGFGLCRALHRDVSLRHTPIILLSWKDDLLARMRELGAQAQGYLRKESPGEAILARVRSVLRGRTRVLRRVAEVSSKGQVRGRIERVGAFPLVEVAAQSVKNATLTLADASSVTELEVRDGKLVAAVRTAQDGSLVRGESALLQSLGLHAGRFVVRHNTAATRNNLSGDLSAMLSQSARRISALEESLTGAALLEVGSVEMDPEAASSYGRSLTPALRDAVHNLIRGSSPRELVDRGELDLSALELLVQELLRRGAIHRVLGAKGEDLGAMRLAAPPDARPGSHRPTVHEAPTTPPSSPPTATVVVAPPPAVPFVRLDDSSDELELPGLGTPTRSELPPEIETFARRRSPLPVPLTVSTPEQERETRPMVELSPRISHRARVETRAEWILPPAAALEDLAPPSARPAPPPSAPPAAPSSPSSAPPPHIDLLTLSSSEQETDSLADAVWRELRGVVDERRPSPSEPSTRIDPAPRRNFTLQDFELPSAPPEAADVPVPLPSLPPLTGLTMGPIGVLSLPEVQLAITSGDKGSLRPAEPEPTDHPPAVEAAIAPPTLRPPSVAETPPTPSAETAAPVEAPAPAEEGASSPSDPVLLMSRKITRDPARESPWESDAPRTESGDPTADTYEFKSFPPPPPGTRDAPNSASLPPPRAAETPSLILAEIMAIADTPDLAVAPTEVAPTPASLRPDTALDAVVTPAAEAPAPVSEPAKTVSAPAPAPAVEAPAQVATTADEQLPPPPPAPAVVAPVEPDEKPAKWFNPRITLKPLTPPPEPVASPPTRYAWLRLTVYVALTFVGSYFAVRWYVQRQPEVAPEPVIDLPPEPEPATPDAATAPSTDASVAPGVGEDAAADAGNSARVSDDAATPYVPPAPYLDGGVLAPRMGLLVIQSQRRGASPVEVQIDQRVVGNAPVQASLTEGLHTLRFRAGIITSYQFATIRPGYALVLEAPSDH